MKTIKEILVLIKEEFNRINYGGLCITALRLRKLNKITPEEYYLWVGYWIAYSRTRKVFYNYKGEKTPDKAQYAWIPRLKKNRNNWIDKHIKLNYENNI